MEEKTKLLERAESLLEGTYDLHIHTSPDVKERCVSDVEAAQQARDVGMAGILIKNHHTLTADRAAIATNVTDFPTYGSLALNLSVGGLNSAAVETAIKMGAKEIWMPTVDSKSYLDFHKPGSNEGISLLDERGYLTRAVDPILELIAQNRIILGTGHISSEESVPLVKRAKELGVRKILVTHPMEPAINMSQSQLRELAGEGVFIEHDYVFLTHVVENPLPIEAVAAAIRGVGPRFTMLATDCGQKENPPPSICLRDFMYQLLGAGIGREGIRTMTRDNPAKLLE
jgi:hypothetical protein